MAYIFVINGKSIEVKCLPSEDPYDLEDKIKALSVWSELNSLASAANMLFDIVSDSDEDKKVAIIFGQELQPDRHIYRGQTLVSDFSTLDKSFAALVDTIEEKMLAALAEFENEVIETPGNLVIGCFD